MASHRIGARVAGLSPAQLCAIIEAQAGASDAALRVAEEHAARLVEQPEWILSEVLFSPDLVPHILAQLPTKEHAVKGTCRAWRRGWKETLKKRDRPRLVVIGGDDNDGEFVNSMERYDPSTNAWEEEAVAPMASPRENHAVAMLDGKLYAVGGYDDGYGYLSSVERYDLATKSWEEVEPMPSARSATGVAVLDGKLYAVGGYGALDLSTDGALSAVVRYDPEMNAWEEVAPMAEARQGHAVAVLDGKLYAVGGLNVLYFSSVERYDPALDAWEAVAPMAAARAALRLAVLEGKMYAVGGFSAGAGSLSSVERYDPAMNAWEEVAPMASARSAAGVAVLGGKLYAIGMSEDEDEGREEEDVTSNTVERFDPITNAWEEVAPMVTARSAPWVALL